MTASSTVVAPWTACGLSLSTTGAPVSLALSANRARAFSSGSLTPTRSGAYRPDCTTRVAMAPPILPPPMSASFGVAGRFTGAILASAQVLLLLPWRVRQRVQHGGHVSD